MIHMAGQNDLENGAAKRNEIQMDTCRWKDKFLTTILTSKCQSAIQIEIPEAGRSTKSGLEKVI